MYFKRIPGVFYWRASKSQAQREAAEAKSQAQREAAEAKSQVQAEAALACSREREARIECMRQQQNKHAQEVKALKGAVQVATVARYQLESSVESMLKDTAKTVAEEYEVEVADLRATIKDHDKEVPCKITMQICISATIFFAVCPATRWTA